MKWQALPTPYWLVIAVVAISLAAIYQLKNHRIVPPGPLVMLASSASVWILASLAGLAGADLQTKAFWNTVEFMGVIGVPTGWFLLALDLTGYRAWLTLRNLLLLAVIPLGSALLAFTNGDHGLMWPDLQLVTQGDLVMLIKAHGPVFWVYMVYAYTVVSVAAFLVIRVQVREGRVFRSRGRIIITVVIAIMILTLSELDRGSSILGIDLTPLMLLVGLPVATLMTGRLAYADLAPLARDRIIEELTDGVIVVDSELRIRDINPAAEAIFEKSRTGMLGNNLAQLSPQLRAFEPADQAVSGKQTDIVLERSGTQYYYELDWTPVYEPGKRVASISILTLRDVTHRVKIASDLEQSLQEKEMLLREIHHRVKNNLQIISSLLNLEVSHDGYIREDAFINSQHRIRSMALIHEQLYRSKNFSSITLDTYLGEILTYFRQYSTKAIEFELRANDGIALDIDKAIPCGLIICEAISNSLKHAFPEQHGKILVEIRQDPGCQVFLSVTDDGVGFKDAFDIEHASGLGFGLIKALASQLDADLRIAGDEGVCVTLQIPLKNKAGNC